MEEKHPLERLVVFIRDVLNVDEEYISIGRMNDYINDFSNTHIVVDTSNISSYFKPVADYDFKNNKQDIVSTYTCEVTVDFYGDDAWKICNDFINIVNYSEYDGLQKKINMVIYNISNIINLRQAIDSQFTNRYQISFNIGYSTVTTRDFYFIEDLSLEKIILEDIKN